MIPLLYSIFTEDFTTLGLGALKECTRCEVTEEVNGLYECEFDYPMTGAYFETLMNDGCTIGVTHDHNGDVQLFDVYRYSAPINGLVTFYASHVSYRLAHMICEGGGGFPSPGELFSYWNPPDDAGVVKEFPQGPTFWFQDLYTGPTGEVVPPQYYNVRQMLLSKEAEAINSLAEDIESTVALAFPGECVFDNFNVKYYQKRGKNNGVTIRSGKNMDNVTRERDTGSIVSRVYPMYYYEEEGEVYTVAYPPADSPSVERTFGEWNASTGEQMTTDTGEPLMFAPAIIRAGVYDLSDLFQTTPTDAQARKAALAYMRKNSTWRAVDNIEVSFIDLYADAAYSDVKELEKCSVGDFVGVYYASLGIKADNVEIMSGTYDVLNERFTSMQLNTIRSTLAQVIIQDAGGKTYVDF